jgi:hypothetical protein
MSGKHTHGPWLVHGNSTLHMNDKQIASLRNHKVVTHAPEAIDARADVYNAHLIASAPDLLALLEELIDIEGPQPGHIEWANKVKAAIRKARGEP